MADYLRGFVKGVADFGVRGIEARQAEAAEVRKAEMLERLRRETAKFEYALKDKYESKKADKALSSIDLGSGERILRNANGEEIGRVKLTPTELEAHNLALEGDRLGVENTRSTINSRALDDARADRIATAQIGSYNRSGRSLDDDALKPMSGSELAKELLYQNEALVTATLADSDDLTRSEVEELAYHVMQNAKGATPQAVDDDANRRFRMALRHMAAAAQPK